MKITDLAKAIDQDKKTKIIGVRPGEKTHEILCPSDDSRLTIEFKEHYIIIPSINFEINKKKFKRNNLKETGKFVNPNFEYNSGNNFKFLNTKELKNYLI